MRIMKHKTLYTMLLAGSLLSFQALAGGGSSGGGGSFICTTIDSNTKNKIVLSAESQDLWETSLKYKLLSSMEDEVSLSFSVIKKLKEAGATRFYEEVRAALEIVLKIRDIKNVKLIPLSDAKHWIEKNDCKEGVPEFTPAAIYYETDLVYAKQVWEKMNNVSQAALNVHEAIYKVLRDEYKSQDPEPAKKAERTRKIVGYLFSDQDSNEADGLIPMDSFNFESSRPYQDKFGELLLLIQKSQKVKLQDFLLLSGKCYELSRPTNVIPVSIESRNLEVNLSGYFDRKNRYQFSGLIYLQGLENFPFYGAKHNRNGSNYSVAFPERTIYTENPVLDLIRSIEFMKESEREVTRAFFKTTSGDILVADVREVCLKYKSTWLGLDSKCLEKSKFDEIPELPTSRVDKVYYCPAKK